MNDIDRYLDRACRQVNGPDSLRAHLRKELKEHLEEAIDALVAEGMSDDDAAAKAIEDLGDPEIVRDGMESVYGPGVTSLFGTPVMGVNLWGASPLCDFGNLRRGQYTK